MKLQKFQNIIIFTYIFKKYQNFSCYFNLMKTKPTSASTKKSIITTKQPIISKKPTIVKCFICNQVFYTQQTFDIHMDQHQKKVNKNLPQQIQRKTMQSFGIKRKDSINRKNTTLQAINQNQMSQKISLSTTMKNPIIKSQFTQKTIISKLKQTTSQMTKKPFSKVIQTNKSKQQKKQAKQQSIYEKKQVQDRQIQQIDQAIKESSMIMNQIAFITERTDYSNQIDQLSQNQSQDQFDQDKIVQKNITQNQFVQMIRNQNNSILKIEEDMIKVNFINKSLENYQIQIQYLRKLKKLTSDSKGLEKINKIKSKVLTEVINLISNYQQIEKSSYKSVTNSNLSKQAEQIVNQQARTCSECLDIIGYGQICMVFQDQTYHQSCFKQFKLGQ